MTDHCREQEAILADFEAHDEESNMVEAEYDLLQRQAMSQQDELAELTTEFEKLKEHTADNEARARQRRRVLRRINMLLQGVRSALRDGQSVSAEMPEISWLKIYKLLVVRSVVTWPKGCEDGLPIEG